MWAFLASWFTPSSLFLFLNLMIGTIVLTARFGSWKGPTHDHQLGQYDLSPQLARAPSLLERVKSINFSLYKFDPPSSETGYHPPSEPGHVTEYPNADDPPQKLARAPSLLERLKSINLSYIYRSDPEPEDEAPDPNPFEEDHSRDHGTPVKRSKSESLGGAGKKSQPEKMTKSASVKSALGISSGGKEGDEEEDEAVIAAVERRRPATARVEKKTEKRSVKGGEAAPSWDSDDGVDAKADDFINRFKQQLKLQRLDSLKRFSEMLKGK
ncbi:hypothetical protein PanWU01x14_223410 [Parasponia andersonii]|uniref:DUF4408 domain-containing protein n=1 Tax=Parasponia andersonii TaxID=3476 RepID=A0A2P5BNV1_PARAD|nr:hypothetical protein PanWU01x14_223410 [Parasponia andersonii]